MRLTNKARFGARNVSKDFVRYALIQNIIVIDKEHVVIVLSDSDIHTTHEVTKNRKEIVEKQAITKGTVHIDRPFRPETLHYKVVMI